ncbi:DUF2119 domain-containing protein [Methanobacterium sp.]|uniref:DUF2119 domain-containing protein n=1 Tax=Methanobacterium sp. TaxID=2164 RepID=UPI002AB99AE5|nr:DUF2119 domain-containing protein [Methanobacterium sp.]MDY9923590.1 DUF2119 domain-containing protein [Methanobacterium sp.]
MEVSFLKEIGAKGGTSRLFAGGVHGKEGSSTIYAIEPAKNIQVNEGRLVLSNFPPSPYMSTLDPLYYLSLAGSKLMGLIQKNKPDIYLELHCYHRDSYLKLTRKDRKEFFGVPGLVELENRVLIGSVSPLIRSVFFDLDDFPFILEIPCNPSEESLQTCHKIMEILAGSSNRLEIMEKLSQVYPQQVETLNTYFKDYSLNFHPAFQEIKQKALETDLKNYQDLEKLINYVIREGNFKVNPKQIKQLEGAFLIFNEYNSFKCNKRTMNI